MKYSVMSTLVDSGYVRKFRKSQKFKRKPGWQVCPESVASYKRIPVQVCSGLCSYKNRLSFEDDTGSITIFIGLFRLATVPSVTYWEKKLPFDLMRMDNQFRGYYLYTSWTADQNNRNVYSIKF